MKKITLLVVAMALNLGWALAQFGEPQDLLPMTLRQGPRQHLILDYNNDGNLDIVECKELHTQIHYIFSLFLGDAQGNFIYDRVLWAGGISGANNYFMLDFEVLDINGDGQRDITFVHNPGGWTQPVLNSVNVAVVEYERFGKEAPAIALQLNNLSMSEGGLHLSDADTDGDLDILLAQNNGTAQNPNLVDMWLIQNSNFQYSSPIIATIDNSKEVMDMDDDGLLDMVMTEGYLPSTYGSVITPTDLIYFRENLGNGVFGSYINIPLVGATFKGVEKVNGDNLPDIIYVESLQNASGGMLEVFWRANLGNFNFGPPQLMASFGTGLRLVNFIDYNADGQLDLILKAVANDVCYVGLNNGNWSFGTPAEIPGDPSFYLSMSVKRNWWLNKVADFDGDGSDDVILESKNDGCGLEIKRDMETTLSGSTQCFSVEFGNVESVLGNFDTDAAVEFLHIPFGGQEGFNTVQQDPIQFDSNNLTPVAATQYNDDEAEVLFLMNTDSDPELEIIRDTWNFEFHIEIYELANNEIVQLNSQYFGTLLLGHIYKADLNGDGFEDLLCKSESNGSTNGNLIVFFNTGLNSFTIQYYSNINMDHIVSVIDMSGDGFDDVVYSADQNYWYISMDAFNALGTPVLISTIAENVYGVFGSESEGWALIAQSGNVVFPTTRTIWTEDPNGLLNVPAFSALPSGGLNGLAMIEEINHLEGYDALMIDGTLLSIIDGEVVISPPFTTQTNFHLDPIWEPGLFHGSGIINHNEWIDLNGDGRKELVWSSGLSNFGASSWTPSGVYKYRENLYGTGCMDPQACNYDDQAVLPSDDCCYSNCGCTNEAACNFDPGASCDNGTCIIGGCMDPTACNFDPTAGCDDGSCEFSPNFEIVLTTELNGSDPILPFVWFTAADNPGQSNGPWLNLTDYVGVMNTDEQTGITTIDFGCVPYDCYQMKLITQFPFDEDDEVFVQLSQNGTVIHYDSYVPYLLLSDPDPNADTYIMNSAFAIEWLCFCPEEANTGCLNQFAFNYDAQADCNDGRCTFSVSGRVFFDENQNGIFDNNDYGLPFQEVTLYPEEITIITNDDGFYYTELPWGTFYLVHTPDPNYPFYTTPDSYAITTGLGPLVNKDFGLSPTEPLSAICVDLYPSWYFCNYWVNFNLCFRNDGNVPVDGIITVEIDPLITEINEITPIDSIVGNMVYFSYHDLHPGLMYMYDIELWTPTLAAQGTNIVNTATAYGYDSDGVLVATGQRTRIIEHLCSYDPNDKQADPMGYTESHFVEDGTAIEYVVRFQNTGTAPAYYVRIEDMIDENLDIDSFEFVANSHSVIVSLNEETRKLVFYHNAIMLPDSFSDEPGSHGLVSYRIRLKEGLQPGTTINNTAYIYFDFNDPVITNTTLHTVFECDDYASTFVVVENTNCGQAEVILASTAAWTESYAWMMDGVQIGNEPNVTITDPGEHTIELIVVNPLCGLRNSQQTIVLEEPIVASILGEDAHLCDNESVTFSASNASAVLQWTLDGTNIGTSTSVDVTSPGLLMLTSTVDDCVLQSAVQITSTSMTVIPPIQQNQNILSVESTSGATYQWYLGGEAIANATANAIEITESGLYTLTATIADCVLSQDIDAQYISVAELTSAAFTVYPNPTNGDFVVKQAMGTTIDVWLVNALGQRLKAWKLTPGQHQLTITDLPAGMYTLETNANARVVLVKI